MTFSLVVLLQKLSAIILLLERDLVYWSLAMDEYVRHEDLCDSTHRSIISYVHGRTELYSSSLPPIKRRLPDPFIAQGRIVTMRPEGLTGGSEVVEILYSI
jgi:hypothetical protein